MAVIPPFNPQERIPNDPFNNPSADQYTLYTVTGTPLTFGDNFFVDYTTGRISVAPNAPNNGTVRQITAAPGLVTSPVTGIITTGSIDLDTIPTLTPGSYTYPTISVNGYGRLTLAADGPTPLVTLIGTPPIFVSGATPIKSLGIKLATTSARGAVQLLDSLLTPDGSKALTAQQGYNLGLQMSYLGGFLGGQVFCGFISTATGFITQLTTGASTFPGLAVGSPLPPPSSVYDGAFFVLNADGTYTPPGGVATPVVVNDRVICINGTWEVLLCGTRLANAGTGLAGLTILATAAEVQALAEPNKSITPGALSVMVASDTQIGFVELATDAEALAFTDNTRAITSSNIDKVCATTSTRGIVRLTDSINDPSVISAPTANALKTYADSSLDASLVTAKGDMIVGQSLATPVILPLGTQASLLVVDDTKPLGLDWNIPDSLTTWPVGVITWHLSPVVPALWVPCDGAMYDSSLSGLYFQLYDIIGTTYNTGGEPAGFFRVPDLRGYFARGWSGTVAGNTPPATALDPGRGWATYQTDAYQQHNHNVFDPGHCMPLPLCQHCHPVTITNHAHPYTDPGHSHVIGTFVVSEVVGNSAGWYDSEGVKYGCHDGISTEKTGVSLNSAFTGVALNNAVTGITRTECCVTDITVLNSPPTAPSPNENRPTNLALLPIIKYANF